MKTILLTITILASQLAFAEIRNSDYSVRHLDLIEKSIEQSCGTFINLSQLSTKEEIVRVDQGIEDVYYTTVLQGFQRLDQMMFEEYSITVKSVFADMYDHNSQNWGAYYVESVTCEVN